jgi:hypothetical protein
VNPLEGAMKKDAAEHMFILFTFKKSFMIPPFGLRIIPLPLDAFVKMVNMSFGLALASISS